MSDEDDWGGSWDGNEQVGFYTAEHAINLARLWKAGKLIGGDELRIIERSTAPQSDDHAKP